MPEMQLQMERRTVSKPAYRVPLMSEIADLPWNGFNAISTFSGCGGSSLGYKMAGFRVLWASEFIPAAQQTYRANHPKTILDTRDIRQVKAEEILAAIGMKAGELDLFDGSPPCASFSTAGSREAGWGKVKKYSDGAQRTDDLFYEFIRLVRGIQPKVFVAENVSGLVKGTAKGYFLEILAAMKASGYRVTCRVLDAQWLGVPQQRQRTIFVGVREDLNREPMHPMPLSYRYTVRDALPWVKSVKHGGVPNNWKPSDTPCPTIVGSGATISPTAYLSGVTYVEAECEPEMIIGNDAFKPKWGKISSGPCPTILASGAHGGSGEIRTATEKRRFTIAELKRICAFPDDFILLGTNAQQWERLGRAVPPVMMSHVAATVRDEILRKI